MHSRSHMSLLRISSLAAQVMIATIALVAAAHAQNTVGTITQVAGAASIQRAGATIAAARGRAEYGGHAARQDHHSSERVADDHDG